MKDLCSVAASWKSAAQFSNTSHRRFSNRRYAGLATLALWLLTSACCNRANAQSYAIDWFTIDGGGGPSTGATYQVTGTIGQPDAGGAMSGGNFSLTGGFWSLYAVQTPGAPLLTINYTGSQAIVSWLPSATGWTLQTNNNLVTGTWGNYAGQVSNNSVTNPISGTQKFYRLIQ